MERYEGWREKELNLKEVAKKYPDIPFSFILKVDVMRRGVNYTEAARKLLDPNKHQFFTAEGEYSSWIQGLNGIPEGVLLRDGSPLMPVHIAKDNAQREPYIIDEIDGRLFIIDQGEVFEEIFYWEKPDYYSKNASNGVPLKYYVGARPHRLTLNLSDYCHFWDKPNGGCKYCSFVPTFKKSEQKECVKDPKYVVEAIKEAVKQEGRFSSICISGGSIISGEKPFDDEVNGYIDLLQRIGTVFGDKKRFPSQLVASAFDNEQLERLYENTGLTSYTADLEVLDAEKFAWICPGKSEFIGFDEWKRRLYYATEVFGRGNVNTGCVLGVELAKPNGFATEDEAFSRVSETIEDLVSHGVAIAGNIWCAAPNSIFQRQDTPSLDYYVRVCRYINQLHHQYEINPFIDDYKRCGMHPVMDLLRI